MITLALFLLGILLGATGAVLAVLIGRLRALTAPAPAASRGGQ